MGIEKSSLPHMVIWAVLSCVAVVGLWIFFGMVSTQEESASKKMPKGEMAVELSSGENQLGASRGEQEMVPESPPSVSEDVIQKSLGLFGLSPASGNTLSLVYADAEFNAQADGGAAWLAMSIRKQCDFFSGLSKEPGIAEDKTMRFIIEECSEIGSSAIYESWQLVEFAAREGQADAVIAQPSFPPPGNGQNGYGNFENVEEWQSVVTDRIRRIADGGNPDAMLKIAEIYAGKFPSETNYDLAERYLAELYQMPGLSDYQESLGTAILKGIKKSKKFN